MFFWVTLLATVLYCSYISLLYFFWRKLPKSPQKAGKPTFISIIIPVRNEEDQIGPLLKDMGKQKYASDMFEVIVVDDNSTDRTAEVVQQMAKNTGISVRYLETDIKGGVATGHKKQALRTGIENAKGDWILTTDGDCRVGPYWLAGMNAFICTGSWALLSGPVAYLDNEHLFNQLQILELSGLVAMGGASINLGVPNMCNGANLAFRKEDFYKVGGYSGNEQLPSGDDEFLMHKIAYKLGKDVQFVKDKRTTVSTNANKNFKELMHQRFRWASKWDHYNHNFVKFIAIAIFTYYTWLILAFAGMFAGYITYIQFFAIFSFKLFFDMVFLSNAMNFVDHRFRLHVFIILEMIYPIYVVIFGLGSNFFGYRWKGREFKRIRKFEKRYKVS